MESGIPSKGGRPTTYNQETATLICARMSEGESLRSICRDPAMPAMSSVFTWLGKHKEFTEQYAIAMAARADAMFEEIIDIADDGRNDYMETEQGEKFNGEHVQRSKLRVDARKWMLSKMMPKKYGDKISPIEIDPADDSITINVVRVSKDANKPNPN